MTDSPVVHIVDDDRSFRTATSRLLQISGYEVANYESANCFLQAIAHAKPGCIVLDVQMPELNGLQLQNELAKLPFAWPIIFMTGHGDIPTSVKAIKAGAEDFLSKPVPKQILLDAIDRALIHAAKLQHNQDKLNTLKSLVAALTPREAEVFRQIVRGKMNKQIAHQLGASERTIKAHRHNIMQKLQVQSFAAAVSVAERVGLVEPHFSTETENPA